MCMIALAWGLDANWPLLLIANRDEFHARPSRPIAVQTELPGLLAGTDLTAGGHWLGFLPDGRFAAVSNARIGPAAGRPATPRSRGELVRWTLTRVMQDPAWTLPALAGAAEFGPFSLLAGGPDTLTHRSNVFAEQACLGPRMHVLSNGPMNADWPKARRARAILEAQLARARFDPGHLLDQLADASPADDADLPDTGVGLALERRLAPLFLRDPVYGTRCSTVMALDRAGVVRVRERSYDPAGQISVERAFFSDNSTAGGAGRCWRADRSS